MLDCVARDSPHLLDQDLLAALLPADLVGSPRTVELHYSLPVRPGRGLPRAPLRVRSSYKLPQFLRVLSLLEQRFGPAFDGWHVLEIGTSSVHPAPLMLDTHVGAAGRRTGVDSGPHRGCR